MSPPTLSSNKIVEVSEEEFMLANDGCSHLECPKCKKAFKDKQIRNRHFKDIHKTKIICKKGRPEIGGREAAMIRDNLKRSKEKQAPKTYKQKYHQDYAKRRAEEKELEEMFPGYAKRKTEYNGVEETFPGIWHEVCEFIAKNKEAPEDFVTSCFLKNLEEKIFTRVLTILKVENIFRHRATIVKYLLLWVHKVSNGFVRKTYNQDKVIIGILGQSNEPKSKVPLTEADPDFPTRMEKYFKTKDGRKLKREGILLFSTYIEFMFSRPECQILEENEHMLYLVEVDIVSREY